MKITISLEDRPSGQVKVVIHPPLERIVKEKIRRKEGFTPAENYAFVMANAVREASRKLDKYDPKRIIRPGL